jgi:hypothetical protein
MNECLLPKWIIKLERGDDDMCSNLLRKKYLKDKGFLIANLEGTLNFGKVYMELNILTREG